MVRKYYHFRIYDLKMKHVQKNLNMYLYFFFFTLSSSLSISSPTAQSNYVNETCQNSSDSSCPSLLSYRLPWDSKLSDVAYRFQVNVTDILASNNIDSTAPWSWNQILPSKSLLKIPISCLCVDGLRQRSVLTVYTVSATDTWDSVSQGYGRLVSEEQMRSVNDGGCGGGIGKRVLRSGERLVVPLPCVCFSNTDSGGGAAVYMSYVAETGENLSSIGVAYGTTVHELEAVNGLLRQSQVTPGDILAIPISACSSANLRWYNESLIVPNGSYSLTANNCIKCSCLLQTDLRLQCSPSGMMASCSELQCKGSNLLIGDTLENQTTFGCNVTACVYRGHFNHKIYTSLVNSSYIPCSGNKSHALPFFMFPPSDPSPSPSPSPSASQSLAPDPPMVIDMSESRYSTNSYRKRKFLIQVSCFGLLFLEIAFPFYLLM